MALECALKYSNGIEGDNLKGGREGTTQVVQVNHRVDIPTDSQRGIPMGERRHGKMNLILEADRAIPSLYQAVCRGEVLEELELMWYRITDDGLQEHYFSHMMTNVRVAAVEMQLPDTQNPELDETGHRAAVDLSYEKILWKHISAGMEYEDGWAVEMA
ncbi:type VI secretion system tube protein TssD [Longibacter sp.]|uniref:type VI secretion system tube protein TssD n=1 Tax=Longibacter sp. TaxID=2045415 RepID=UPI003EBFC004